ncbi:NUDIX hydrolase [Fredinandcohnia sp. 179-A 10B2 NHS]|uniref:NUDIX hydrolase n=1 Tax=Fredinandcohnia sp. 179-A 10B2 NHS TaxID=3235176 RepID=UPI00399F1F4A
MSMKWLEWAQQIQAISQSGLAYSKDVYDIERFKELRNISAEIVAEYSNKNLDDVKKVFINEEGYQTPKVDVRAVIFREDKILLVKEKSDNKWTLPGGWADIGISPSQNAVKEVEEESGYIVTPKRLLAVLDRNMHGHTPNIHHSYKLFIECILVGGEPKTSVETSDVGFFSADSLPPLSIERVTEDQIKRMFEYNGMEHIEVWFD